MTQLEDPADFSAFWQELMQLDEAVRPYRNGGIYARRIEGAMADPTGWAANGLGRDMQHDAKLLLRTHPQLGELAALLDAYGAALIAIAFDAAVAAPRTGPASELEQAPPTMKAAAVAVGRRK